ncbi:MAG TPA: nitroreductase family protein, partial [Dehalococcoidia bacterium]|nr:nitroreductase family protein [Dehalococcoidia bacterium]
KAPSGSNRQPWKWLLVRDTSKRAEIARLLRESSSSRAASFFEEGAKSPDRSTRLMYTGALNLVNNLDQAPVFVIPCLHSEGEAGVSRVGFRAGGSIYGAVQNLQLAARGFGLGTVFTSFDAGIEPQLRELLGIPEEAQPMALIPLGYSDAKFGPTKRKPVEEVTFWEEWGRADPA